jgi:metallophosphoesterase superfamily enzyme
VLASVGRSDADAVLYLGDLTVDGANQPDELEHARSELERLDRPWYVVPGNHDVGDNSMIGGTSIEKVANDERMQRWLDIVGVETCASPWACGSALRRPGEPGR